MSGCVCLSCGQKCLIPFYRLKDGIFHLECFRCSVCNVGLHNKPFFVLSGKLVCYDDIKATCCYTCQTIIKGDRILTQFGNFHKECFQCSRCGMNFTPTTTFYIGARKLFCHECCLSLKSSSCSRRIKSATKIKNLSGVRKRFEQHVEESNVLIPKHFNEELRIRLAAQFKAVERHVITSSRCENAVCEMDTEDKEADLTSNQLKLRHEGQKKKEVKALSPQPKLKYPEKPSACTPNRLPGTSQIFLSEPDFPPKCGSCSHRSSLCFHQEFTQMEITDGDSTGKCSTLSTLGDLRDSALSGREEILKSPTISPNSPPPAPLFPSNNNQEPSRELEPLSSKNEFKLAPQLTEATHTKTNVNALVKAYEKITAQAKEHVSSNAPATDQNSPEPSEDVIGDTKGKFCGSQTTPKLPIQFIPDLVSQNSAVLTAHIARRSKLNRAVEEAPKERTLRVRALLLLILSIIATSASILLCLGKWVTPSTPEDPANLRSLGIEIAADAIRPRPPN